MARRAGVVPLSLSNATVDAPPGQRTSPTRGHPHSPSHGSHASSGSASSRYSRPNTTHSSSSGMRGGTGPSGRSVAATRESTPRSVPPQSPTDGLALAAIRGTQIGIRRGQLLPRVAELTTGISPYTTRQLIRCRR